MTAGNRGGPRREHRAGAGLTFVVALTTLLTGTLGACATDEPDGSPTSTTTTTTHSSANAGTALTPTIDPNEERRRAVATLVAQRVAALKAKDKKAWLATVDDVASPFGQRQSGLFDRMVLLPIMGFGQSGVEIAPALSAERATEVGPDAWVATVHQTYQLAGYDRAPRTYDVSFTVVRSSSGWRLADDVDGGTQPQPWDLPGVSVVRSATTLVIGNAPVGTLRAYLALADAAHRRISGVWGSALPAVLVVPATVTDLTTQLQRDSAAGLEQVAAITDGPISTGSGATSDRVYINPQAFARLTADGRRVVVAHELTHVTVRGTTRRPVPIWLSEGFADYVGFSGLTLPRRTVAADLLKKVRAGTGPTRLPVEGDFDPAQGVIAPTYNAAWLAVVRMAQVHGQEQVVAFYRAVAGDLAVDRSIANDPVAVARQAFSAVLGTNEDTFVADWLAYLKDLAR